ncbi:MAG TPA: HAMP domain-containing sensor histidine kinase [Candidatus Acidoferrales bacterium]|nr:HAMP domain-containing sensor histidine kinase [Candidatus Acidoferrales bacterium]
MPRSLIRPLCYVLLVAAWILDLLTPQLFVAAIFLCVPIALSSLLLDAGLTRILVVLALVADVTAGYANGLHDHHWVTIAVANRVIVAFSFLLVGVLSVAAQRSARRAGELSERSERAARERRVRHAIERMRQSISVELIERSLVREACASLDADVAWFYRSQAGLEPVMVYRFEQRRGEIDVGRERPPGSIASLVQRVADQGELVRVDAGDALGRLVLDTLSVGDALAVPIFEHETRFGVLLVARRIGTFDADSAEALRYYAEQSAVALAQGQLFEELAKRNEELGRANAALVERSDVIRDIIYALSHDLRTPLAAAGMTMRQAIEGRYGELPAAYREILERSVQSNDELQRLAETLLLVSRYESGEASRYREVVNLLAVARDVVAELEPLWRGKSVSVRLEGDQFNVLADRGELRRAIVNLIANAVHWTPGGGTIDVRSIVVAGRARLSIADTGFGVPAGVRDQLFERIGGASRHGGGSGLGLYIVRRIAEGHGGSVSYEPRPGGGSVVALDLPLADIQP